MATTAILEKVEADGDPCFDLSRINLGIAPGAR
jgi:hypothetical protein